MLGLDGWAKVPDNRINMAKKHPIRIKNFADIYWDTPFIFILKKNIGLKSKNVIHCFK